MANRIISFTGDDQNFLDTDLSANLSSMVGDVFTDISMDSMPNDPGKVDRWKVQRITDAKAVFNSLHNIFTWIPGERILLPEFGSRLRALLYEGITPQTEERIVAEIRHLVSEWEPRASILEVVDVSTVEDTEDNVIHLNVVFTIPALSNKRYSYDLSFTKSE